MFVFGVSLVWTVGVFLNTGPKNTKAHGMLPRYNIMAGG